MSKVCAYLALGLSGWDDPLEGRKFWREINEGCWDQEMLRKMISTSRWLENHRHRIPALRRHVEGIERRKREAEGIE